MGTNILPKGFDYSQTGSHLQSAVHLNTAKLGSQSLFVETNIFCVNGHKDYVKILEME
jgi:hypothetical protein